MKLLVFSDLHLEHQPRWSLPESFPDYDVCVAAGDIDGSPTQSIRRLAAHPALSAKPIIFAPGNHEFYGSVYEDAIEKGLQAAAETGVHYLNASAVVIDGVRFVGATLWSSFSLHGNREVAMIVADGREGMEDFKGTIKRRAITPGVKGKYRFQAQHAAWHHTRHRTAIQQELAKPFDGATVVVTHHAPSPKSLSERYSQHRALDPAYASDLEELMQGPGAPELWLHGHIHASQDYVVGGTRVLSNPKGYGPSLPRMPTIENPDFNPALVIEVQPRPKPKLDALGYDTSGPYKTKLQMADAQSGVTKDAVQESDADPAVEGTDDEHPKMTP
ncbi:MAG: metallophosphoesterase [Pseudorhodoplanes sp.]|nr:metallophosphoesterase [Pseudorhodoplanes sp.]